MKMFEQNIINLYGKKGRQWQENLPNLVTQLANTYGLSNLKLVDNLSYNYVLWGFQGPQPIILKLGLDIDGFKREAAALMALEGFGVVQIFSENTGLLLLKCAVPGVSLKSYFPEKDDEAINITASVIKRLHKAPIPSTHAFPHIKDWLEALDGDLKIPVQTLQKAREIRDQLLKTAKPDVLLHGDLHHDNILQNGEDWLVIDPKGVIGEPAYEVAAFIRNPMPELLNQADAPNIIHNRVTRFAEALELSEHRIIDWCFVQAVLACVWALEDGCDISYFEQITKIFDVMPFND
ncbi:Phosphotrasferase family protein [Candidatus Trichorickettsia mobilis]|uniref:Phosphotrasferase family protein n=1 Tax=Candidatus Trichorickettsia mobilis TaxID=1346319 RepID=A0ABZ0URR0_9RICK|nr:aminoglycoside phosphotransferase family protein [Candidatus Trichorickettsia mobilis]WPY00724.1 Phosphotrasferase family protein [Candidatus Trichorickettsia mobilis]